MPSLKLPYINQGDVRSHVSHSINVVEVGLGIVVDDVTDIVQFQTDFLHAGIFDIRNSSNRDQGFFCLKRFL